MLMFYIQNGQVCLNPHFAVPLSSLYLLNQAYIVLVHHSKTAPWSLVNRSASHLLAIFFSARTTFSRFRSLFSILFCFLLSKGNKKIGIMLLILKFYFKFTYYTGTGRCHQQGLSKENSDE